MVTHRAERMHVAALHWLAFGSDRAEHAAIAQQLQCVVLVVHAQVEQVTVALVQFGADPVWIGLVLAVFFSGQFIEGNILQPKLVGQSVGLHPVWLMFALFAFGALFGFVGLLVAVPAAAAIGVLVRFALNRYLESDLYFGSAVEAPFIEQDEKVPPRAIDND